MTATFIIGGARSGKSRRAQMLAEASGSQRLYIATAVPFDVEMRGRIKQHQADRGQGWTTLEAPLDLPQAIEQSAPANAIILIDCLTLWLNNLIYHERDIGAQTHALIQAIKASKASLYLVSNEIGLGLVPETPLGREFRDAQGRLNQDVAKVCKVVEFMAAGLPLTLKSGA